MKNLHLQTRSTLIACLSVLSLALLGSGCATPRHRLADEGPSAKVVWVKGGARWVSGDNAGQLVRVGDVLGPGTLIQTANKAEVELFLRHGPATKGREKDTVRLRENSLLGIDALSATDTNDAVMRDTQLDLKAGRMYCVVQHTPAPSRYEVRLPQGIAGTRGSIYEMSAEGVIEVFSGLVVLAYVRPDGTITTQLIEAPQNFDARTGTLNSSSVPKRMAVSK